jgi:serine/threonine-protein kinase
MQLQLFGEYVIESEIEQGPTWALYRAVNAKRPNEHYVARVLRGMNATQRNVIEGFARGAYILEQLKHPGIVPVVSAGVDQGVVFIIKPEIDGTTLAQLLANPAPFDPADAVRIIREASEVLDFCHRHDPAVPHYALEPSKILLTKPDRSVRVLEVGYVHALEEVARVEPMDNIPRAPDPYRAPEMTPGAAVSGSADQYALAMIATDLLSHCGPVSAALKAAAGPVLARATARDPAARFPTTSAFAQALHDAIVPGLRPVAGAKTAGPPTRPSGTMAAAPPTRPSGTMPRPNPSSASRPAVSPKPAEAPAAPSPARPALGGPGALANMTRSKATIIGAPPLASPKPAVAPAAPMEPAHPADAAPPSSGNTAKFDPRSEAPAHEASPAAAPSAIAPSRQPAHEHDAPTVEAPIHSPTVAAARALSKLAAAGAPKNRPATIPGVQAPPEPAAAGVHDAPTVESRAAPTEHTDAVTREVVAPAQSLDEERLSGSDMQLVDSEFASPLPPIVPSVASAPSESTLPDAVAGVAPHTDGEPLFAEPPRAPAVAPAAPIEPVAPQPPPPMPPSMAQPVANLPPVPSAPFPPTHGYANAPPRAFSHGPIPSTPPPPRGSGVVRAATVLGVCIVLASVVYTGGFMLREPLMRLAAGRAGGSDRAAEPGGRGGTTTQANMGGGGAGANTGATPNVAAATDAAVANVHAPIAPNAATVQAPPVAPVAAVDAGAAVANNPNEASPAPNVAAAGSVDASVAAPPPSAAAAPIHHHPGWRERQAVEEQITAGINACEGHVGHHARFHVTYAGATGQITQIEWSGTTFVGLPITTCIEQAIRGAPMPRFTDSEWRTDFSILVH